MGSCLAEDDLLAYLDERSLSAGDLRDGLSHPIRLIVPSAVLRAHLSSRLVTRLGRPLLGLRIQTLYGYAREVLEAAGEVVRPAGPLEAILVERAARETPRLGPLLEDLKEGFRAPIRPVRDLLDSGDIGSAQFDGAMGLNDPSPECAGALRARSLDILSIARATAESAESAGLDLTGAILRRAAQQIARAGSSLPCRGLVVFGFSDATGVAGGLLRAALAVNGGAVFVDLPLGVGPARGRQLEQGNALRTVERLVGKETPDLPSIPTSTVSFDGFGARGPEGEVQECARRIRELIDEGAVPERIGLVASSLEGYGPAIRRHFVRLGVPCGFGSGQASSSPLRRWESLPTLLVSPADFPDDEFVGLLGTLSGSPVTPTLRVRLRAALRSLGYSRLGQLAEPAAGHRLDDGRDVALPVVSGLRAEAGGAPAKSFRVKVSASRLRTLFSLAESFLRGVEEAPVKGPLKRWVDQIVALLHLLDQTPPKPVLDALLGLPTPPGFEVTRAEAVTLVKDALAGLSRGALGGPGAGVALLSMREARSWTFDHLFVLGVNRGCFPKAGGDDPLLPERERRVLRRTLPRLPRVAGDVAVERYGVAQLLSSSPRITLSWQTVNAAGKASTPSPLVPFLMADVTGGQSLPEARSALPVQLPRPSPPVDYVMRAGLYGSRDEVRALLPLVLADSEPANSEEGAAVGAAVLGSARLAILDEVDPDLNTPEGVARWAELGPFLGQVGARVEAADPRYRDFSAHSLEGLATCPWRTFLKSYLGLRDLPDPGAEIPQVDARLTGTLVHQVLEDLACEQGLERQGTLADVLQRPRGVRLARPSERRLAEVCLAAAENLVLREGLVLPGLAELLRRRAMVFLEQAFADGALPPIFEGQAGASVPAQAPAIIGVEVSGVAEVAGYRIGFRADRVDRAGDDVVFVDYKSGKAVSEAVGEEFRRKAYFAALSQGNKLQAAIYSAASGPARSIGRYFFLKPAIKADARVQHDPADPELADALESTVTVLARGLHEGQLFPRLVGPKGQKEPAACGRCVVSSACVRGDSGARARLVRYSSDRTAGEQSLFQELWLLPTAGKDTK